jgi:hypothetical protein
MGPLDPNNASVQGIDPATRCVGDAAFNVATCPHFEPSRKAAGKKAS